MIPRQGPPARPPPLALIARLVATSWMRALQDGRLLARAAPREAALAELSRTRHVMTGIDMVQTNAGYTTCIRLSGSRSGVCRLRWQVIAPP